MFLVSQLKPKVWYFCLTKPSENRCFSPALWSLQMNEGHICSGAAVQQSRASPVKNPLHIISSACQASFWPHHTIHWPFQWSSTHLKNSSTDRLSVPDLNSHFKHVFFFRTSKVLWNVFLFTIDFIISVFYVSNLNYIRFCFIKWL